MAQTVITGLVVAFSIAILGTAGHTLSIFDNQQTSNPWWLPLWPQHFDVHGTKALIASAAVSLVLSGVFLVMSLIPKASHQHLHTSYLLTSSAGQPSQPPDPARPRRHRLRSPLRPPHPRHRNLCAHSQQRGPRGRHDPDLDLQVQEQPAAGARPCATEQHGQRQLCVVVPSVQVCAVWNVGGYAAVDGEHRVEHCGVGCG